MLSSGIGGDVHTCVCSLMLMPYNRLRLVSAVVLFLSVLYIEWFHYSRTRPYTAVAPVVPQTGKRGGTVCFKNMRATSGISL